MSIDELDKILYELGAAHSRKKERQLARANAEIEAINREDVAYYDGAYDAIKQVKALMERVKEEGRGMSFQCNECKNKNTVVCVSCTGAEGYSPKPSTNADRIRAMTDEELACFLLEVWEDGEQTDQHFPFWKYDWMNWLKKEADND